MRGLALLLIADVAPLYLGSDKGFYEDERVTVKRKALDYAESHPAEVRRTVTRKDKPSLDELVRSGGRRAFLSDHEQSVSGIPGRPQYTRF